MSRQLVAMIEDQLAQCLVTAARPSLATDGVAITSWRTNGEFSSPLAALFLDGSAAQTVTSPTGGTKGVELWGYRLQQWWKIGVINNGDDVEIVGVDQGFACEVDIIGIFERIAVAGTPSAGATTAKFVPLQQWSAA